VTYQREISRDNKACILFLLDQSHSMTEPLAGSSQSKAAALADAVNAWLLNMAIRASGDEGVRDWLDVGVLGYRTRDKRPMITPALVGPLAAHSLVSIVDVANSPARIETTVQRMRDDDTGEWLDVPSDAPVWVEPVANGSTPMCHGLIYSRAVLEDWIKSHRGSFPPIVVHITDGASQDGDPLGPAAELTNLATNDGRLLLFNCHLSSSKAPQSLFPASPDRLPDDFSRQLFAMSSVLPDSFQSAAAGSGLSLAAGARGMAFNADMAVLVQFLDMGTRPAVTRR
jgi:hypothetical protein